MHGSLKINTLQCLHFYTMISFMSESILHLVDDVLCGCHLLRHHRISLSRLQPTITSSRSTSPLALSSNPSSSPPSRVSVSLQPYSLTVATQAFRSNQHSSGHMGLGQEGLIKFFFFKADELLWWEEGALAISEV